MHSAQALITAGWLDEVSGPAALAAKEEAFPPKMASDVTKVKKEEEAWALGSCFRPLRSNLGG